MRVHRARKSTLNIRNLSPNVAWAVQFASTEEADRSVGYGSKCKGVVDECGYGTWGKIRGKLDAEKAIFHMV